MTAQTPAQTPAIEEHPDIAALRARYDRVAETPTAQLVDGLTLLTGLYLAMSPWVVGFTSDSPGLTASNLFSGVAVALLALGFASAYGRTHGITWVTAVIGAWTIIAPWLVNGPTPDNSAIANNVITGALCLLFGLAMASVGMRASTRRGMQRPGTRPDMGPDMGREMGSGMGRGRP
ncbi:SPW repeat protein [Micromonospora sp. CPCC 205371]|nr:SPW repeat protein [Micromonospora sp. CPCC 205371]